jgi:hypothetical protein
MSMKNTKNSRTAGLAAAADFFMGAPPPKAGVRSAVYAVPPNFVEPKYRGSKRKLKKDAAVSKL